jgi:hypothetical protein
MASEPLLGIVPGDEYETARLSPCVGGLVRTWTKSGQRLWGVEDADSLASMMGRGLITRTLREEDRFREVALLDESKGLIMLLPRMRSTTADGDLEGEARLIRLTDSPSSSPSTADDLRDALAVAVGHTKEVGGFLVVELGGWDAPFIPYCLFLIEPGEPPLSTVETAPLPERAALWKDHVQAGAAGATLSAPASPETVAVVPTLILDAIATWGVEPWDLALTFGRRRPADP